MFSSARVDWSRVTRSRMAYLCPQKRLTAAFAILVDAEPAFVVLADTVAAPFLNEPPTALTAIAHGTFVPHENVAEFVPCVEVTTRPTFCVCVTCTCSCADDPAAQVRWPVMTAVPVVELTMSLASIEIVAA